MKKTLIALAALAVTGAAFAQSSVTLSGSLNVGVVDTGAAGAKAAVTSLGGGANAINFQATEDLGGGLNGGFTGQIRMNSANGNINSAGTGTDALFHAANAFVGGSFGTFRIGKIAEAGNCGFDPWACTGGAALSAGTGISALVGAGTQASSLSYATPNFSGLTASFQTTMTTRDNERTVLTVNYGNGPLALGFVRTDSSANTVANGGTVTDVKGNSTSIGASYKLDFGTVSFVNVGTENAAGTKTASINSFGLTVPMGAVTLLAGYNKDSKKASNADTKLAVGVNYALSKRTTLGADVFNAEQGAGSGSGYALRVRHTF